MYTDVKKMMKLKENVKKNGFEFNTTRVDNCCKVEKSEIGQSIVGEIEALYNLDMQINENELNGILNQIKERYNEGRIDLLLEECKKGILDCIIQPFGLVGIIFKDQIGGNVDTIHNVRNKAASEDGQGVYATQQSKEVYENRGEYTKGVASKYHQNENYIKTKKQVKEDLKQGNLQDSYRNGEIKKNDKIDIDHIISTKEIHEDPGRVLAGLEADDLANKDSNLTPTDRSVNRSMQEKNIDEYISYLEKTKHDREKKIKELESKETLNDQERKKLNKLRKLNEVDVNKLKEKNEEARKAYEKEINETYYYSKRFQGALAKTSIKEGVRMGFQQAIGLLLREFALAIFDEFEIKSLFSRKKKIKLDKDFITELKLRLEKVAKRIMNKWDDVVNSFAQGTISGFFSNVITVIINTFYTTVKRTVKMIREGFYSLIRAFKILLFHGPEISPNAAAHEATKILTSGIIVGLGIEAEEALEKALQCTPIIAMMADKISAVIVGIITGLAIMIITYLIDKLDLFGAMQEHKNKYICEELDELIEDNIRGIDSLCRDIVACDL